VSSGLYGPLYNPPGRSQISFRIGTWSSFRELMLALVKVAQPPGTPAPPLADLALGGPDDWVAALIDAWAVVGDILTFYQERIANEGFLGTATQPFSVAQMFQMIGFPLPTATAAETHLQLTVSKTTAAGTAAGPGSVVIPAGSPVRSLPGQARTAAALDQLVNRLAAAGSAPGPSPALNNLERLVSAVSRTPAPPTPPAPGSAAVTAAAASSVAAASAVTAALSPQVFETTEPVAVHPGWNSLLPWVRVKTAVQEVRGGTTELRLAGTSTGLAVGQPILVTGEIPGGPPAAASVSFVRILTAVTANRAQGYTLMRWEDPLDRTAGSSPLEARERLANPQVFAFGNQLPLFGASAPDWGALPVATRRRFATIQGGLLRQAVTASGIAWESASAGLPAEPLNALATTGGTLFAGMAASGVFASADGGQSWSPANNGLARKSVQCLLAAGPPGQVLAGVPGAVYRSTDGGRTWEPLAGGPPQVETASPPGAGIQVIPTNLPSTVVRALDTWNDLLVAGTDSGIFTYDGASWRQAHSLDAGGSPPAGPMGLPVSAFASLGKEVLFAAASHGVYQSADGLTWSPTPPLPAAAFPLRALAAGGGHLFAGGWNGVYRAKPGGAWNLLADGPPGPITVLSFLPDGAVSDADTALWAGTAQDGLWISTNLGESWTPVPLPLPSPPPPASVLALLAAAGTIFAATPFDGFAGDDWPGFAIQGRQVDLGKTDGKIVPGGRLVLYDPPRAGGYTIAQTATVYRKGFLLNATVTRLTVTPETGLAAFDLRTTQAWVESRELELAVASVPLPTPVAGKEIKLASQLTTPLPAGQKLMLTGQSLNAALLPTRGVLRRQGERWVPLGPLGADVTALVARGPELWAAAGDGVFQIATAGGLEPRSAGLAGAGVTALALSPGSLTLFAGTSGSGVFRWNAGGESWEAWGLAGQAITALAAAGDGALYAATAAGPLFQNPPGGSAADWLPLPAPAPAVLTLAADPDGDQLYAGTAAGVWSLAGTVWAPAGAGLADLPVATLLWSDGRLSAGTLGSGVFQLEAGAWQPVGTTPGNGQVAALAALPGALAAGLAGSAGVFLWDGGNWQPAPTGVSNSVQALAVTGGELFAGTGAASRLESPAGLQALAVQTDPLFPWSPEPGERASLDQGNLPADLVEAFAASATPLSPLATVAPRARGEFWIVQDTGNAVYYLISQPLMSRPAAVIQVAAPSTVLRITGPPQPVPGSPAAFAETWPLASQLGFTGSLTAFPGEVLLLPALPADPTGSEVARLQAQSPMPGTGGSTVREDDRRHTRLVLAKPLSGFYDAATVSLSANVAHVTNGQSVQEVLGSGDASQPNQGFQTRRTPVIHLATADGPRSTLAVQVNGVPWHEVSSLGQAKPDSRVYSVTYGAEGHAAITFGDGQNGATLPTGRDNVVAFYRGGSQGPEAELEAGRLVQLLASAGRIQRVTNPQPASRAQASANPLDTTPPPGIRTLRRAVTAGDFAGLLLAVPGVAQARAQRLWTGGGWLMGITVVTTSGKPFLPGSRLDRRLTAVVTDAALPGTAIVVQSFQPAWFDLSAALLAPPGLPAAAFLAVEAAAQSALTAAFGATAGRLGEPVTASRITSVLQGVPGLAASRIQALYRRGDQPGLHSTLPAREIRRDPRTRTVLPAELLRLDTRDGLTLTREDAP
jgi:hypothetical protein